MAIIMMLALLLNDGGRTAIAQEAIARPPVVTTPAERNREEDIIILREGKVMVGTQGEHAPVVIIERDDGQSARGARERAAGTLDRDAPRLNTDRDETIEIRRIAPGPVRGGGVEIRVQEGSAAAEARGRANHSRQEGRVSAHGDSDPDIVIIEGPNGHDGNVVSVQKTRSGKACVTIGTIGAVDQACRSRR